MEFTVENIAVVISLVIILSIIFPVIANYQKNKVDKNLKLDMLLIKVPKYTKQEKEELSKQYIEQTLGKIENFFSALAGLKAEHPFLGQAKEIFSLDIVSVDGFINFYAAVPPKFKDFFIAQLQAVYPKIYVEEVVDYNIFQPQGQVLAGNLSFANDFTLPIKTYKTFENDPLEGITNTLSKLTNDESAVVQYVFKSAPKKWHQRGRQLAQKMQAGATFADAIKQVGGTSFFDKLEKTGSFFGSFFATSKKEDEQKKKSLEVKQPLSAMEQERAKSLEAKTSKAGLDVNIRIVVSTRSLERSKAVLLDVLNSYNQYNIYEFGNRFQASIPRHPDTIIEYLIYRHFSNKRKLLLNAEEMVSVVHLPLPTTETPNIDWLEAVKAPPPSSLPSEGIILGKSIYRGKETLVRIKDADRRRHMYEIGQTGTGKSAFMESLIKQDIEAGKGLCVIDPHGELVERCLTYIPKERAEDVIVFDPSDTDRPVAINMLEYDTDEQKTFVINEMIAIFDKLYDLKATGGPMFEQYMRNAMLLVMDDKDSGATLLEVPRVLSDEAYRKHKLSKVKNRLVKDFWEKEAQKAGGEASLANMVPYITSKLTPFIANDIIRPIIAQQKSAFNFREAMDSKKIIMINLSKGKIGDMNSSLLGMIIIGKLLFAALSRADYTEEQRNDFYLYIDEFQNYTTDSIAIILSEARKYKLNLIIAHQYIAQLVKNNDTKIRDAVFGNVGTIIAYRLGVEDAEVIAKQMAPVVTEYDLINMPKFTAYIKLLIDNANPPAFNFNPIRPEKGNFELAAAIKQLSRLKYGRDRKTVEDEVQQRIII
ncbi:MAG: type IV secretion system DNA-binding domain-containing protein [Patescibacteria group bacterium]